MVADDGVTHPVRVKQHGWLARIDRAAVVTVAVASIALVVIVAALGEAGEIAIPTVLAALAAIALAPLVRQLERIGAPASLAAAVIVMGVLGSTAATLYVLAPSAEVWNDRAPQILRNIEVRVRQINRDIARSVGTGEPKTEPGTI